MIQINSALLEPNMNYDGATSNDVVIMYSAAISLKRIADALEKANELKFHELAKILGGPPDVDVKGKHNQKKNQNKL